LTSIAKLLSSALLSIATLSIAMLSIARGHLFEFWEPEALQALLLAFMEDEVDGHNTQGTCMYRKGLKH